MRERDPTRTLESGTRGWTEDGMQYEHVVCARGVMWL